jgi:3-oxoacyl-[acyl-carrier protein] reductase
VAIRLAQAGCEIALHYRRAGEHVDSLERQIRDLGRPVRSFQADLATPEAADILLRDVVDVFGTLQILVNNAGITCDDLLVNLSVDKIRSVLDANLLAPMLCTRAAAMTMLRNRYGRIVNISSAAASKPGRGQSNYVAAKGGLESFTKAMAVELASRNILVNAVAPGVIRTEMSADIRERGADEIMSRLLVKRFAEPEEVAETVWFLAGPHNKYMTGEILHLDGGLRMP